MVNILFHIVHILFIYTVNRVRVVEGGGQRDQNVHNIYNVQNVFSTVHKGGVRGIPSGSPEIPLREGGSEVKMYITSIIYLLYFLQYAKGIG